MVENREPATELDRRFSSEGAGPTEWAEARELLQKARIYWLSTVRPDGRPHVTPLYAVCLDDAIYFATGASERKAKNLSGNAYCIVMTGCNIVEGVDVVVEGDAVTIDDDTTLRDVAELFATKYDWHYEVRDGAFHGEGGRAEVYKVAPATAFGFGKGDNFSQTRWRF